MFFEVEAIENLQNAFFVQISIYFDIVEQLYFVDTLIKVIFIIFNNL